MHRIDQIFARHFVIDTERIPTHRPIGLPLNLATTAGDRCLHFRSVLALINDGSGIQIRFQYRDLEDFTGLLANRQERAIGLLPFFAERRQHNAHHIVVASQQLHQCVVEPARGVAIRRADKLVVEAEIVEEGL